MTSSVEITCRTADAGGDIDPLRAWFSIPTLRGRQHLIFLVHGYNDTVDEARDAYKSLDKFQTDLVQAGRDWTFGATLVHFFWPGDAQWGIARPAFYPWALALADKSAALLGDIIKDLANFAGGRLVVDVVAHSMGNRVALRSLSLAGNLPGLEVRRSIHMASAVPVGRLEDAADELARGLRNETATGKAASLYSSHDGVLAYAFPVGETADFPQEGVLPVALGHRDWPLGHTRENFSQWDAGPAGHGDYWFGRSAQVEVHEVLDLGVSGLKEIVERATPVAAALSTRDLASRTTASRGVGDEIAAA